ncbi:MAG: hypothetical protein JJ913_06440 [Rhizobiaceae bacterium]|nr:hypothetical protein [Rhizobiaceae bacterium]
MADFVAVLKKTISGLSDNTPQMRERVYQKARDTVAARLAAMQPQPSSIVVERQKKALETAIEAVEAGYAREDDGEDEFAAIFSGSDTKPAMPKAVPPETVAEPATSDKPEEPAKVEPAATGPEMEADDASADGEAGSDAGDDAAEDKETELAPVAATARPVPELPGSQLGANRNDAPAKPRPAAKRRISGGLIAAVVALFVVAAAGYGIWLNRDAFMALVAPTEEVTVVPENTEPAEQTVQEEAAPVEQAAVEEEPATEDAAAAETPPAEEIAATGDEDQEKFTQRLTVEGGEVDPGPAGGTPSVGEGTSVATATQTGGNAETGASGDGPSASSEAAALPVGQRAIFYEERTTVSDSTAERGATVWSVVQESPGADAPPEPAIRAEVTIPSKDLQMRMTIRRNADPSLPASHIIEMIFLTSESFEGGGVDNVLRVALKPSEAAPGNPLIGIPAKITDGYFLIALSSDEDDRNLNLQLMRQQSWIDIPIVYSSGRRALVTMERGVPGDRAFIDVLETWQKLESEQSAAAGN